MNLINTIPNMKELFGTLTMGRIETHETRRVNGKTIAVTKKVNMFSDMQKHDNVYAIVPANAIDRDLKLFDEVQVEQPQIEAYGKKVGNRAYTKYRMLGTALKKANK